MIYGRKKRFKRFGNLFQIGRLKDLKLYEHYIPLYLFLSSNKYLNKLIDNSQNFGLWFFYISWKGTLPSPLPINQWRVFCY